VASREVWKRRLGPLFGGAVALASSSVLVGRQLADDDDVPVAGWLVAVGAALGLCGYAVAVLIHRLGVAPSAAAALGLVVAVLLGGAVVERGVSAYVASAADAATATTAIAGSLIVRSALVAVIPAERWLWAFPAIWVIGRWAAMFLQAIGDPILDPPPRSLVTAPPPAWAAAAATAGIAVIAVAGVGWSMVIAMGLAAAAAFGLGLAAQRRRGGLDAGVVALAALAGELITLVALAAA
jgi:hypothetical protein